MNALAARRRHPAAIAILLLLGLVVDRGGLRRSWRPKPAQAAGAQRRRRRRRARSCSWPTAPPATASTPQGTQAGPSLVGVGAASVDFQVGTGRMPLARPGRRRPAQDDIKFTDEQIAAAGRLRRLAGPRPGHPGRGSTTSGEGADVAKGGELFRVNCAMCHNFAGSGGALTRGKYAPTLRRRRRARTSTRRW